MPIFHSRKLIFVHIPKNAGRSVEEALLSGKASPDGGRRSLINRAFTALSRRTAPKLAKSHLIGSLDVTLASQHLTYVEMEMLGLLDEAEGYQSFAIVRNPYDRALSSTIHFSDSDWLQEPDPLLRKRQFAAHLARWLERPLTDHNKRAHRRGQLSFLRDQSGRIAVNTLLRFETITTDFYNFTKSCGVEGLNLPVRGSAGRKVGYRDYFNEEARKLVEKAFGEDIDTLKYSF